MCLCLFFLTMFFIFDVVDSLFCDCFSISKKANFNTLTSSIFYHLLTFFVTFKYFLALIMCMFVVFMF
jgi:hypothetical protein